MDATKGETGWKIQTCPRIQEVQGGCYTEGIKYNAGLFPLQSGKVLRDIIFKGKIDNDEPDTSADEEICQH